MRYQPRICLPGLRCPYGRQKMADISDQGKAIPLKPSVERGADIVAAMACTEHEIPRRGAEALRSGVQSGKGKAMNGARGLRYAEHSNGVAKMCVV